MERSEDLIVAEDLGRRADSIASPTVTCDDLHPFQYIQYHSEKEKAHLIPATTRLRPGRSGRRDD
jgi:hypothetical protein